MSLVGGHLHVVLAMGSNEEDGPDSGFEPRSLRRMIEELCHEVHVTRRVVFILCRNCRTRREKK